jgi:hypothetical protein
MNSLILLQNFIIHIIIMRCVEFDNNLQKDIFIHKYESE